MKRLLHFDENGFQREIKCLMKVKHQNVVRFLGYCNETRGKMAGFKGTLVMAQEERLLCFQYLSKGGLNNYINAGGAIYIYITFLYITSKLLLAICMSSTLNH